MSNHNSFISQRIARLLHRQLLVTLANLNDPFWKQVNITRLTLRADLHVAHVFYTFFGKLTTDQVKKLIDQKQFHLKQHLSKQWRLKRLPKLVFVLDQQTLKQEKILNLLENNHD